MIDSRGAPNAAPPPRPSWRGESVEAGSHGASRTISHEEQQNPSVPRYNLTLAEGNPALVESTRSRRQRVRAALWTARVLVAGGAITQLAAWLAMLLEGRA